MNKSFDDCHFLCLKKVWRQQRYTTTRCLLCNVNMTMEENNFFVVVPLCALYHPPPAETFLSELDGTMRVQEVGEFWRVHVRKLHKGDLRHIFTAIQYYTCRMRQEVETECGTHLRF